MSCNGFIQEFELMAMVMDIIEFPDDETRALTIKKLGMIYDFNQRMAKVKAEENGNA